MTEEMPRNLIGQSAPESPEEAAAAEGISEAEWRAKNLPASKLELRWRYQNRKVQLYERRLRSLRMYNIGPALHAWIRSRMEWMIDNKLYERPNGVLLLTVDPEGDVDIQLEPQVEAPQLTQDALVWEDGVLAGCKVLVQDEQGEREAVLTPWVVLDDEIVAVPADGQLREASDTLAHDLATTLGKTYSERKVTAADLEAAELFAVSGEFGIVPFEGKAGAFTAKLTECFEKLWAQK